MTEQLIVYSQPSCAPCSAAKNRLRREGIAFTEVDVTTDGGALERLRDAGHIMTPVFEWAGGLHGMDALPRIIQEARGG